jgi:hypothetical protein
MGVIMLDGSSAFISSEDFKFFAGGNAQAVMSKVAATRAQKVARFMVSVLM